MVNRIWFYIVVTLWCQTLSAKPRYYLIGGVGDYHSQSDESDEADKEGYIVQFGGAFSLNLAWTQFFLSGGYAYYDVEGKTSQEIQKITQGGIFWDLSYYFLPLGDHFSLGLGINGLSGRGAYLKFHSAISSQNSMFLSPKLKFEAEQWQRTFFSTLQYDLDLNVPHQVSRQVILSFGVSLDILRREEKSTVKDETESQTEQIASSQDSDEEVDDDSTADQQKLPIDQPLNPSKILFAYNSSQISNQSQQYLTCIIATLKKYPSNWQILGVVGHANKTGSDVQERNVAISKDRAEGVANYILVNGIASDKLKIEWYGNSQLRQEYYSYSAKQQRVELKVKGLTSDELLKELKTCDL